VLLWSIAERRFERIRKSSEDLFHFAPARNRKIHAARLAIDVPELETGFANRRVVDDRKESRRIGHDRPIEERLVVICPWAIFSRLLAEEFSEICENPAGLFFYHPMSAAFDDTTCDCLRQVLKLFERPHAKRFGTYRGPFPQTRFYPQ